MKQFSVDWEFSGKVIGPDSGCALDVKPISVGVVCDDGREYYAIIDADHSQYDDPWLEENVIAKLNPDVPRKSAEVIRKELWDFILEGDPDSVTIWSDQAGYDQILFHSILSPKNMFCVRDFQGADKSRSISFSLVRDYYELLGKPDKTYYLPKPCAEKVHIAIDDARFQMEGIRRLDTYAGELTGGKANNYAELKSFFSASLIEGDN